MSDLHLSTIKALALAIDAKDEIGQRHVRRAQVYAAALGKALGMSDTEIQGVKTASLLHDIGKLAVPGHHLSQAGSAHTGRVSEDSSSSPDWCGDHRWRAISVSGGAADSLPPRALGWQGLSGRAGWR